MVSTLVALEKLQRAPVGRFRHVAEALVTFVGKLIVYVAVDPAVTETTVLGTLGAVVDPKDESTSNCNMSEIPPPGAGVCTLTAVAPGVAISDGATVAVSCDAFTYCVARGEVPQ
jgi:hypothetical protein